MVKVIRLLLAVSATASSTRRMSRFGAHQGHLVEVVEVEELEVDPLRPGFVPLPDLVEDLGRRARQVDALLGTTDALGPAGHLGVVPAAADGEGGRVDHVAVRPTSFR